MIIFGVLIGILMVWAKIFRFGIRLPIYPELSPFTPPPDLPPSLEPSWGQFGNFSIVRDQCRTFSFSTLVNYGGVNGHGDMSDAPRKPREKATSEGGSADAAAHDDGSGAKKRWRPKGHHARYRAKAKKAKGDAEKDERDQDPPRKAKKDDEIPPLSKQDSSVVLKPGKPRPNVFLALRLSNPEIHSNVRRFQEKFLADNPKLGRLCVPVQKSHVSLQVKNHVQSSRKTF